MSEKYVKVHVCATRAGKMRRMVKECAQRAVEHFKDNPNTPFKVLLISNARLTEIVVESRKQFEDLNLKKLVDLK